MSEDYDIELNARTSGRVMPLGPQSAQLGIYWRAAIVRPSDRTTHKMRLI